MDLIRVAITEQDALARALGGLARDGAVLVQGLVDVEFLRRLHKRMDADTERLLEFCARIGGNPGAPGHLQQGAPTHPPYLHRDVLAHPFVWEMARELLGPEATLMYYCGNTNCPGSGAQEVHIDQPHANAAGQPMSALSISIPVQDMGPENGAIELWPGTHALPTEPKVAAADLEARRAVAPPIQPRARAGDVLIRNPCTWHRGVSNPSEAFRHMIAVVIHRRPKGPVDFDHSAREFVEAAGVPLNPRYGDRREEYLFGPLRWVAEARSSGPRESKPDEGARPLVDV
ncbi:MAG TPA: phytanoyl-CoA dioxygenase family protein [Thermoanaerobaculia bacterium]|nr:phytanoyl-CoA dioxygenase family protein [Thermoanaerobaculia bacterium]